MTPGRRRHRRRHRGWKFARRHATSIVSSQKGKCFWCHQPIFTPRTVPGKVLHEGDRAIWYRSSEEKVVKVRKATLDHLQPTSKGGKNELSNVVAACPTCNRRRGNGTLSSSWLCLRCRQFKPDINVPLCPSCNTPAGIWDWLFSNGWDYLPDPPGIGWWQHPVTKEVLSWSRAVSQQRRGIRFSYGISWFSWGGPRRDQTGWGG